MRKKTMEITRDKNGFEKLKGIFLEANRAFLENHAILLKRELSERCLCGALMYELNKQLEKKNLKKYHADIEFNRVIKKATNKVKQLPDEKGIPKHIFPDIIVHTRSEENPDNLLALEMKKSTARGYAKERDKNRLSLLTSLYPYKYKLGVYYEINHKKSQIMIEFYQTGRKISTDSKVIKYKITEEGELEFIRVKLLDSDI